MRQGITLVEILCVIAIVMILAGLLFPIFGFTRRKGMQTQSISNMRQIGFAAMMYMADNDDYTIGLYGSRPYTSMDTWPAKLMTYTTTQAVFSDPTRNKLPDKWIFNNREYLWNWIPHYGMNLFGFSIYTNGKNCEEDWGGQTALRHTASITNMSTRIMIMPITWGNTEAGFLYFKSNMASNPYINLTYDKWCWYNCVWDNNKRYFERVPVIFADGHVNIITKDYFIDRNVYSRKKDYCTEMYKKNLFIYWGKPWLNE